MEILTFCTAPVARRQGIGRALLAQVLSQSAKKIFLEVAADNIAARALYEATGFRINGKRANYYRRANGAVDALMYVLER